MQTERAAFARQVQEALADLYDPVALRFHPLARLLAGSSEPVTGRPGEPLLRRRLLDAIEALKPLPEVAPGSRAWRAYRLLQLRYVADHEPADVQRELAIGRSQYYREHEAALAALAALLWEQRREVETEVLVAGAAPEDGRNSAPGPAAALALRDAGPVSEHRWKLGAGLWWRLVAGATLAVLVVPALLLFAHRASPPATNAIARAAAGSSSTAGPRAPVSATLSIYAGTGQPGHLNGAAAQAQFRGEFGLAVGSDGTLYVADTGNNLIRRITTSGLVLDFAGSGVAGYADGPAASAQFNAPNAVWAGPDGTVYVGDAGNDRIRAVSPAGIVSTLAGSGATGYVDGVGTAAEFVSTGALVADSKGNVYLPDPDDNVVRKVTPAGVVTGFAGSGTRGHLDGTASVAEFNNPQRGGCVDGADNVYVLDTGDNRIRKISQQGVVSTVAGTGEYGYVDGPVSVAQFSSNILGVCADSSGTVFVMDAGNHRVRVVGRDGIVSTLFEFVDPNQNPGNVKVDKSGNLYLSDRDHNVIYRLTVRYNR